jgi:hypothetical protein
MGMTLWPRIERRINIIEEAEVILQQRMWAPIYEEGGLDALIQAKEIQSPPPTPTEGQVPMSDYI